MLTYIKEIFEDTSSYYPRKEYFMSEQSASHAPKMGAQLIEKWLGVIELKRVSYGNTTHWGGDCVRYLDDEDFASHVICQKDDYGRTQLKVVLQIHPQRSRKLGFSRERKSWALVEVYSINLAQGVLFARLKKYLPRGNPWFQGLGYEHPQLNHSIRHNDRQEVIHET